MVGCGDGGIIITGLGRLELGLGPSGRICSLIGHVSQSSLWHSSVVHGYHPRLLVLARLCRVFVLARET